MTTTSSMLACEHRSISGFCVTPPKNNVCENEPTNDFHDVNPFVSLLPVIGPKRITSWKSFVGSFSQTLFFGGVTQKPEIRLCSQASSMPDTTELILIQNCGRHGFRGRIWSGPILASGDITEHKSDAKIGPGGRLCAL